MSAHEVDVKTRNLNYLNKGAAVSTTRVTKFNYHVLGIRRTSIYHFFKRDIEKKIVA